MNRFMPVCAFAAACAFAVSVSAQDTTVKSKTKISADDAHLMTMTGCLQAGSSGDMFVLSNATMVKSDEMKSKSKTTIDRDSDETQVKDQSKTEIEHGEHASVGTAGSVATYNLMAGTGVDLTPHVGHRVQVTAVATEPGKGDADITARTETKVKTDDEHDAKMKSKTKIEMPRGDHSKLTVMSVKHISPSCTM